MEQVEEGQTQGAHSIIRKTSSDFNESSRHTTHDLQKKTSGPNAILLTA